MLLPLKEGFFIPGPTLSLGGIKEQYTTAIDVVYGIAESYTILAKKRLINNQAMMKGSFMSEQWLREYGLLALRINKVMQTVTEVPYVDGYYGPTEWKEIVEAEPVMARADLVRTAMNLADVLPEQGFEAQRASHLGKLVVAMEAVCRKLNGESFSFEDEVQRYYDMRPGWIPESRFEEALAIYDAELPGKGTLASRLQRWRAQYLPSPKHTNLFSSISERILAEMRRRTKTLVDLPEGESVEIRTVTDKPFSAANYYLGNYRTLVEINTDRPVNMLMLVDDLCHEAYPGHHTECVLKEQHLYQGCEYVEQSIPIVLSPPCLISEGIAMFACDMIFAPGELEQWLAEHVYPDLELTPTPVDLTTLRRAGDLLNGVWCNAVLMVREGCSEEKVQEYLTRYMQPVRLLDDLKMPFFDSYVCTYYYGKHLLSSWLQDADQARRQDMFRRFLTEQLDPSELV